MNDLPKQSISLEELAEQQGMATVRRLIRNLRDGLPVAPIVLTAGELEERKRAGDPFVQDILATGVPL